jgi:hypothetical protein
MLVCITIHFDRVLDSNKQRVGVSISMIGSPLYIHSFIEKKSYI